MIRYTMKYIYPGGHVLANATVISLLNKRHLLHDHRKLFIVIDI